MTYVRGVPTPLVGYEPALVPPPQSHVDELVQRILLPHFNRLQAQSSTIGTAIWPAASVAITIDLGSSCDATSPLLLGLDVAESMFKALPVAGPIVESVCATVKKLISAAEVGTRLITFGMSSNSNDCRTRKPVKKIVHW